MTNPVMNTQRSLSIISDKSRLVAAYTEDLHRLMSALYRSGGDPESTRLRHAREHLSEAVSLMAVETASLTHRLHQTEQAAKERRREARAERGGVQA